MGTPRAFVLFVLSLAWLALAAHGSALAQDAATATASSETVALAGVTVAAVDGAPVSSASVELLEIRDRSFPVVATTQTGADGTFRFPDLTPGQWGVRIRAKTFAVVAVGVRVEAGMEPIRLELPAGFAVTGRLVDDATDKPIADGRLISGMATAVSGEDGSFELGGMAATGGQVQFVIRAGDYRVADRSLPAGADSTIDAGEIRLRKGAAIRIRLRDENGAPVADAPGLVYPLDLRRFPTRGTDNINARSGADGDIRLRGLAHDQPYSLQISMAGWPDHVFGPMVVPSGVDSIEVDATLTRGIGLTGRVTSAADGSPIEGASARLAPVANPIAHFTWSSPEQEQGFTATSTAAGSFLLDSVAFGTFLLEVNAPGFRPHRQVVHLDETRIPGPLRVEMRAASGLEPDGVKWVPNMAVALDRSIEENLPAFIFMTMDGEVANEYMAVNTYRQPWIWQLAAHTIPVLSSAFRHSEKVGDICPKYGSVTCEDHMAAEGPIAARFLTPEYPEVPQHIFLRPSGDVIERRMFYLGFEALRNMLIRSIRTVNPERGLEAATEYYEGLVESLRYGDSTERAEALRDLLILTDNVDDVARTALLAADLTTLSPDQERAILDRYLPGAAPDRNWFIAELLLRGSPVLRADAIRRLRDEPADERVSVLTTALGKAGDYAIRSSLERALGVDRERDRVRLSGLGPMDRMQVALALANHADPAALPHLFELIRSDLDAEARNDCALALTKYPANRVLPFLAEELAKGGAERSIHARVLGDLGDPRGVQPLRDAMQDASVVLRISAARSLGMLGDRTALPQLREILDAEGVDGSIRVSVAAAMLDLGAREAIPVLIDLIDHPVHGAKARARLRAAYTERPPQGSGEWQQWWNRRGGRQ